MPTALFVGALALRLPRLGTPGVLVFDEVFYVTDAVDLLDRGVESGGAVHPPLGKWLVAGGIRLAGLDPVGWRLASAVAGAVLVVLTYAIARRVVTGYAVPALAASLVALDGIVLVTSRLALLDVFVAVFMTAALYFVVAAWARRPRWRAADLVGCAVCLGLGSATKWSAVVLLPVAVFAFLLAAQAGLDPAGERRVATRDVAARYAMVVVVLLGVPAAVHLGAHAGWFLGYGDTRAAAARCDPGETCEPSAVTRLGDWVAEQHDVARFHADLEQRNDDAVPLWTWLAQTDPVALFRKRCLPAMGEAPPGRSDGVCPDRDEESVVLVSAAVNPVVWGAGLAAGAVLAGRLAAAAAMRRSARRPGRRGPGGPAGPGAVALLLAAGAVPLVPWLATGREVFSFYAVTLVPVLAVWVAAAVSPNRPLRRWLLPAVVVAAAVAFVLLYPVWTAMPVDPQSWLLRAWFTT